MTGKSNDNEFVYNTEMNIIDKLLAYRKQYIDSVINNEKDKKNELLQKKGEWDYKLNGFKNERDIRERIRLEDINTKIDYYNKQKEDGRKDYVSAMHDIDNRIDQIKKKLDVLTKLKKFGGVNPVNMLKAKRCFLDAVSLLEHEKRKLTTRYEGTNADLMEEYEKSLKEIDDETFGKLKGIDERKQADSTEYDEICREIENKYIKITEDINGQFESLLNENARNYNLSKYLEKTGSYIMSGENYSCPNTMPERIHFGSMFVNVKKTFETAKGFDRLLLDYAGEIISDDEKKMTIKVPYLQNFGDGVSLVIRHNGSDMTKDILKDIVLKTLMYFPAGKAVTTMIDPKGLGGSFVGLGRLGGDKNTWLRDTKIWSEEVEIEAAIDRFRETVENWIQIYGNDKEALFEKEQLKILAIMDFPQHFSRRALDGLSAVIRNSKDTGTIVYIMTAKNEFDSLLASSPERCEDFRNCVVIKQQENRNEFVLEGREQFHISFDGFGKIRRNADDIVSTISKSADSYQPPIIPFSSLYDKDMLDSNNWFMGNPREFCVPIGYHSFNAPMSLSFGAVNDTRQNVLIEGMPRSGKTNLLHNIILGGLINYNPQYLQFYLIDFKDGVEFREYADYYLPGIKMVAVDAQREFALNILEQLVAEMTRRNNEFGRVGTNDIESYNQIVGISDIMPRIVLIFDEITALFSNNDAISEACLDHLIKIQTKGGNVGIHTILATQDYNQCSGVMVERDFSLAKVRIVTFGRDDTKCSILKSTDGMAIGRIGSALFNDNGGEAANNRYLRVATSKKEVLGDGEPARQDYLERLDKYFGQLADIYSDYETKVWTQDMEKNPNIYFNRLLLNAQNGLSLRTVTLCPGDETGLLVGNGISNNYHIFTLKNEDKENLLILSSADINAAKMVESIVISLLLSIVCESAVKGKSYTQIYILDGSVRSGGSYRDNKKVRLSDMADMFGIVNYYRVRDDGFMALLMDMAAAIDERMYTEMDYPPIYLFINKIDDMEYYFGRNDNVDYKDGRALLNKILFRGPSVGVHVIITGEYYDVVVSNILNDSVNDFFNKRIAVHLEDSTEQFRLVYKREIYEAGSDDRIAIMFDRISEEAEVELFSVYDIPDYAWVEEIADILN